MERHEVVSLKETEVIYKVQEHYSFVNKLIFETTYVCCAVD